jgi:hypothetical protein
LSSTYYRWWIVDYALYTIAYGLCEQNYKFAERLQSWNGYTSGWSWCVIYAWIPSAPGESEVNMLYIVDVELQNFSPTKFSLSYCGPHALHSLFTLILWLGYKSEQEFSMPLLTFFEYWNRWNSCKIIQYYELLCFTVKGFGYLILVK